MINIKKIMYKIISFFKKNYFAFTKGCSTKLLKKDSVIDNSDNILTF